MINFSDDHVISGCEDGYLRLVQFAPNRVKDLIGFHEVDGEKSEILGVKMSCCG